MWKISSPDALVVSIIPSLIRPKPDPTFAKILDQRDQMPHGSPQPVQPPGSQCVARLQHVQAHVQSGTIGLGTRQLVSEDEFR
jgi:hypothetical protein